MIDSSCFSPPVYVCVCVCVYACVCSLPKAVALKEYIKEIRTMNRCVLAYIYIYVLKYTKKEILCKIV